MKCTQCRNDFDEFYTFCPHCGKEREQIPTEKASVSSATSFLIHPIEVEHNATYKDNIAFLRDFCASSKMLAIIVLLVISVLYSLVQIVILISNFSLTSQGLGLSNGAPILTSIVAIVALMISAILLIGLIRVYVQAKGPFALTGTGFRMIGQYALVNIWLLRIVVVPFALLAMVFVFWLKPLLFFAAFIPFLLIVPIYLLFLASRDFCELLAYAIDGDEMGTLPYPFRVQRWLKWLTKEYGFIFVISILFLFVIETPETWADTIDLLNESVWFVLLQTALFGLGWYFVKDYGLHLLKRNNQ